MPDSAARRPHDDPYPLSTDAATSAPTNDAEGCPPGVAEPMLVELRSLLLAVGETLDRVLAHQTERATARPENPSPKADVHRADEVPPSGPHAHHREARGGEAGMITFHPPAALGSTRSKTHTAVAPLAVARPGLSLGAEDEPRDAEGRIDVNAPNFATATSIETSGTAMADARGRGSGDVLADLDAIPESSMPALPPGPTLAGEVRTESGIDDRLRDARERMQRRRVERAAESAPADRGVMHASIRGEARPTGRRHHPGERDVRWIVLLIMILTVSVVAGVSAIR